MKYDFTTMVDRRGHDSIAVDLQENDFWTLPKGETKPEFDKIPMWIADMNFPTVSNVTEAIMQRVSHPIYGYFVPSDEYYDAIIRWHKESFDAEDISRQNIGYENGVLGGITSALQVLAPVHSPILVHSPTYTGFTTQLEKNIVLADLFFKESVRVVGTNGSLTGYAGGIDKKISLLELEHADMNHLFIPKKGTAL